MSEQSEEKLIHLLYVPTIYCNMGCRYCYLGEQTDTDTLKTDAAGALDALRDAVDILHKADITPFNISLHGGEVTTLPGSVLGDLFLYIRKYYQDNQNLLRASGFRKTNPHIKTNLYNFDIHYELLLERHVSISASVDLPLSLHEKYRTTKAGGSTLQKILKNIKLLAEYPHRAKMSAVFYRQHLEHTDEIVRDIRLLHEEYGFDMNNFNFMFGFASSLNNEKQAHRGMPIMQTCTDEEQVVFYERLRREFAGGELQQGFCHNWFDEFTTSYCTNCFNCGQKFFLLQRNGDLYSCVRGQGSADFYYGNIFQDNVERIMRAAEQKISMAHRAVGMAEECKSCAYLALCHTGCPFVKTQLKTTKSYTCALQRRIYADYPDRYPSTPAEQRQAVLNEYVVDMHPQLISTDLQTPQTPRILLPNDFHERKNALAELIAADEKLRALYSPEMVYVEMNGRLSALESQILKHTRTIDTLRREDAVVIHVRKSLFTVNCRELVRNRLLLMLLRDTKVIYGDERRAKQEHTYNFEIFYNMLRESETLGKDFVQCEINGFLDLLGSSYQPGVLNNLFVTTGYLRQYHYEKQKNNAFYHIQAINLPFQNMEFYWKR